MNVIQALNWSAPKLDSIRTHLVQQSEGVWYHVATNTLVLIKAELLHPEVLPSEPTFTAENGTSFTAENGTSFTAVGGYDTACLED